MENLLIIGVCSAVVWLAGIRLARHARILVERGAGQAFVGAVLLGGVASLPEMGTALAASVLGNASLAVNTLLGGIGVSVVILAVADVAIGSEPLSTDITHPVVLLEAALVVVMLAVVAAGVAVGDTALLGAGVWTSLLLAAYVVSIAMIRHYQRDMPWVARRRARAPSTHGRRHSGGKAGTEAHSVAGTVLGIFVTGTAILGAGFFLARSSDTLAARTGLGSSFVGFVLGGIVTSLPRAELDGLRGAAGAI